MCLWEEVSSEPSYVAMLNQKSMISFCNNIPVFSYVNRNKNEIRYFFPFLPKVCFLNFFFFASYCFPLQFFF